jgi:hypothetical protein
MRAILAVLNSVPPEPEIGFSIAQTPINSAYFLGRMLVGNLIC